MDCAVIAIGDNLAASVLITMNLKELGIPFIVCKAHDETHRKVLEKLGVDRVVIPEQEYAQRLARTLNSHNVLDYIELSEDFVGGDFAEDGGEVVEGLAEVFGEEVGGLGGG